MRIERYPEADVPSDLRRQVLLLQDDAWPGTSTPVDTLVHDPALDPLSVLLTDEGVVVSALDVLRKPLQHAGSSYLAGGLSTVVTRADRRGAGHGHRLVTAARAVMIELGLDLAIFTCDRGLGPFYGRAGFRVLPGTVLVGGTEDNPFPSDQPGFDKVAVGAFFDPAVAESDFHHARIGLYPGDIDKLW
ncbi:GNAT family N-acetyltransferase [Kribbella sp. NPDC004875]|uniref:GNAT family N-acetyltransferase n=1 Tax=Kribbella sp. NPDC004875 TaxID=3364107 RepID=UPI00368D39DF